MTQEQNILTAAQELFFRLGVKSITMDDLARELGVSKKTIYKFVENKSDLVRKVMLTHFEVEKQVMEEILASNMNAMEEMEAIIRKVLNHLRTIHPSSIYDIQKYYPKSWKLFTEYKDDFIYLCIMQNLKKGIDQGLYRNEINAEIIAKLYISVIDFAVNPKNFPPTQFNFSDIYKEFVTYHLHGIATLEGTQYLSNNPLSYE